MLYSFRALFFKTLVEQQEPWEKLNSTSASAKFFSNNCLKPGVQDPAMEKTMYVHSVLPPSPFQGAPKACRNHLDR
jgi:hypothetical protein